MIGTLPMIALAPLEYRYALDAAMSVLAEKPAPIVLCNVPELMGEVRQRIPYWAETHVALAALWVEPLDSMWQNDLESLAGALPAGAPLVVIASRPLAHLLPERRSWGAQPLGLLPGGISRLYCALAQAGFVIEASYGIHTVLATGLSLSGRLLEYCRRPDLGDRLHFAARLRYCTRGPLAALSTVALLITRKELV